MLEKMIQRALKGEGCTKEEAIALEKLPLSDLMRGANRIRKHHFGNQIQLCAIINAKNGRCDMDCAFCSQSGCADSEIEAYDFLPKAKLQKKMEQILETKDCRCSVVTSGGQLSNAELNQLIQVAEEVAPAPLCASLGRLSRENLEALKSAGIVRFHHNLETSKSFYPSICTTQSWEERKKTVEAAQEVGMDLCRGGLFGLGESWLDRIDLALSLRDLKVDSVPINFLYAHEGTRLSEKAPLSAEEGLRIIAIYRFLLPCVTLRICGGRTHVLGERQADLFAAGANGMMTGNYLTVAGSNYEADMEMIAQLGLKVLQL
jgi:biotin synthase